MRCPCHKKEWRNEIPNLKLKDKFHFGDKFNGKIIYNTNCWHSSINVIENNDWPEPKLVELEV